MESRNSRLQMGLVGLMFLAFVLATYFRSAMPLAAGILLIVAGQALRLSRLPKDILSHLTDTGRRGCDGCFAGHRPHPYGAAGEVRRAAAERIGAPAAGPHRL